MANRASAFASNWIANAVNQMPDETKLAAFVRDEVRSSVFNLKASVGYPQLKVFHSSPQSCVNIENSNHPIAKVVNSGELLVIEHLDQYPNLNIRVPEVRAASFAPISVFSHVIAVLAFFSETHNSFDATALVVIRRLCESLAHMAVASWKLEQLQQAQSHLSALSQIMQSMAPHEQGVPNTENPIGFRFSDRLIEADLRPHLCRKTLSLLSPREQEVLKEFRARPQIDTISSRLKISPHTVRNHLKSIFQKVGVHSRIELLSVIEGLRVDDENSTTVEANR